MLCVWLCGKIAARYLSLAAIIAGVNVEYGIWCGVGVGGAQRGSVSSSAKILNITKKSRMEQEATANGRLYRQFHFVFREHCRQVYIWRFYLEHYLLKCLARKNDHRHQSNASIRFGADMNESENMHDLGDTKTAFGWRSIIITTSLYIVIHIACESLSYKIPRNCSQFFKCFSAEIALNTQHRINGINSKANYERKVN